MDERLRHLEQDMAVIKETMATREDMAHQFGLLRADMNEKHGSLRSEMHSMIRQQTAWMAGVLVGTTGLFFTLVKLFA